MLLTTTVNGKEIRFDTQNGHELTIPVKPGPDTVNGFYINDAVIKPFLAGGFVGSTALGGACNCEDITFNAHGNGTHTECLGHISKDRVALHQCLKEFLFMAELVTIEPEPAQNGDFIITVELLEKAVKNNHPALLIRTLPNDDGKLTRRYSGTNPVYLTQEAALWIRNKGVKHLLVDMPSVDREEDEGALLAHHAFWNYPENPRMDCTITEFIYADAAVADGEYVLNISVGAFDSDASPSRVVVYPLTHP